MKCRSPPGPASLPGQRLVTDFPVLHAGLRHARRPGRLEALALGPGSPGLTLDYEALLALPATEQVCDIHCVTGWSKLDTRWKGVKVTDLLEGNRSRAEGPHVVVHATGGWTTNLPLEELLRDDVLLAYEYDGAPSPPSTAGPSAWSCPGSTSGRAPSGSTDIEFTADERLGYWERVGYHRWAIPGWSSATRRAEQEDTGGSDRRKVVLEEKGARPSTRDAILHRAGCLHGGLAGAACFA